MKRLKLLGAVAMLTVMLPLTTSSASFAAGPGPGPCTRPGNMAVGPEGPAMNGGQLMAGVGQCRSIGSWYNARAYWGGGYGGPRWGPTYPTYYGAPGPTYYGGPFGYREDY
jgi:hypothetical protein